MLWQMILIDMYTRFSNIKIMVLNCALQPQQWHAVAIANASAASQRERKGANRQRE